MITNAKNAERVGIVTLKKYLIKYINGGIMDLSDKMKQDIKRMFNDYVIEYSKVMPKEHAIQFAMHKTRQNAMVMLKTYNQS